MDPHFTTRFLETIHAAPTMAAEAGNQQVLFAAFDAIVRGDFDSFGESLTDDAELQIRGSGLFDGIWRGRTAVVSAARSNFAKVSSQQPEIESMISQGDVTAVLFRESGVVKEDQRRYSMHAVQWFTFVNGKISRIVSIAAHIGS